MKKSLRLLGVFSFFLPATGFSQTTVSGKLTQNTTWTADASPYVLTGDVIVPPTIQLTIRPGVTIERADKAQIAVSGSIMADGSAADSIFLITNDLTDPTVAPFIEFSECDLSHSSLRFLSFQSANLQTKNIRIGSESESSSPVKNSGILTISRSNLSDGNLVSHGFNSAISMNIDSCFFNSAEIHSAGSYAEQINITNSVIQNSTELADQLSFGIRNTNCSLSNTTFEGGAYTNISLASSKATTCSFITPANATLSISKSTIANSPVIGVPGGIINIDASDISTDNADTSLYPKINDMPYLITAFQANITGTNFTGVDNIDAVAVRGTGTDTTTVISHNTFTGFGDAVTVYAFSNDIHMDSNNFEKIKTYDIINFSDKNFNAIYNYYQLAEGQVVNDVIYDRRDNPAYGLVNYIPYATDPVLPLHLLAFIGSYSNNQVTLQWQTTNEINTSKFVVQYLSNGSYQDAGIVTAKGGLNNSYQFTLASISNGANTYRLKMIDKDGSYTYSGSVSIVGSSLSLIFNVYPNPAAHYIFVSHAKAESASQLELADMNGKIIKTGVVAKDDIQNKIAVDDVAKGTYKIIWRGETVIESRTVMIQ